MSSNSERRGEDFGQEIGKAEGILAKEGGRSGEKMGTARMGKGEGARMAG